MGKEKDVTLRKVAGIANMAHWPMLRNCPQYIAKAASWAIRKEIKNITVHDFLALQNKKYLKGRGMPKPLRMLNTD